MNDHNDDDQRNRVSGRKLYVRARVWGSSKPINWMASKDVLLACFLFYFSFQCISFILLIGFRFHHTNYQWCVRRFLFVLLIVLHTMNTVINTIYYTDIGRISSTLMLLLISFVSFSYDIVHILNFNAKKSSNHTIWQDDMNTHSTNNIFEAEKHHTTPLDRHIRSDWWHCILCTFMGILVFDFSSSFDDACKCVHVFVCKLARFRQMTVPKKVQPQHTSICVKPHYSDTAIIV